MMTVKLISTTCLCIIIILNKLTNNNSKKLSSSTLTDLTEADQNRKGSDHVNTGYQP